MSQSGVMSSLTSLDALGVDPFRLLVEAVVEYALYLVDAAGHIASWNPAAERIYGYRAEEILGLPFSVVYPPEEATSGQAEANWARALDQGHHEFECRRVRKGGAEFWAIVAVNTLRDAQGRHAGFAVVTRDITERKQAEAATRAAHERYCTLFEHAQVGILLADAQSYYIDANACACRMLGYSRDELLGKHARDIVVPAETPHIATALRDLHAQVDHQREWQFRRKDGSVFWADVVATPMPDGTLLGMLRDLTPVKERERELARLSRLYAALSHVNQAIVWMPDRAALFRQVCRALVDQGGFCLAWIGWLDPQTRCLLPVAQWGAASAYLHNLTVSTADCPEGQGPSGLAFRSGQPYVCNNTLHDPATARWREEQLRHGLRSSAAFPIRLQGEVQATLNVYAAEPDFFHEKEVSLLTEAAADLSFALDNFARDEARRQAELTLRDEKHFSDTMIESMPGILYFYDGDGRFLRWNRNFEAVSGYSPDEIGRMHPLDFFAGADKAKVEQRIREVLEQGESWVEAEFVNRDGTATPYYFTGRRVQYGGQTCLVGVGIDISDRRRTQERLVESERKYRELVENANSIILRWNAEGRITFLNEYGQRFFGYTAAEIIGQHVSGTIVPATESSGRDLQRLMEDVCAAPEAFEQNLNENMRRNGERVWIAWTNRLVRDAQGRVVEILSIGTDITARRRAETALRETELRLHTLFEQTPVGVVVVDPATLAILECNAEAARQLGYTRAELCGLCMPQLEALEVPAESRQRIAAILRDGAGQFETRHRCKSGELRDVLVSARVLELTGGTVLYGVFFDITERKRGEAEREMRHRAEAADRIKSAFLATMSHELRTPLNSIIGFTGIILQGLAGPLNAEQQKQLGMVRTSARHLLALVNDVLDISKIEAGQLEVARVPFDVRRSIDKVLALIKPQAEAKSLDLHAALSVDLGQLVADERRFEQILLNLLSNAVKFTTHGSVTLQAKRLAACLLPGAATPQPALQVCVADTGLGIRAEDMLSLFQPFKQLDAGLARNHEGTGLGLAICRRLADLMGGEIHATSVWGQGSTFCVTLPVQRPEPS